MKDFFVTYADRGTYDIAAGFNSKTGRKSVNMGKYPGNFAIAVHPGDILREMLDEKGIAQSQLARHIRTDVARINEICRRRRGISAEMAVKLARAFATSEGLWMNLQKNWELSKVDPRAASSIRPLRASA
jgi:addiction module HigA family antidote